MLIYIVWRSIACFDMLIGSWNKATHILYFTVCIAGICIQAHGGADRYVNCSGVRIWVSGPCPPCVQLYIHWGLALPSSITAESVPDPSVKFLLEQVGNFIVHSY